MVIRSTGLFWIHVWKVSLILGLGFLSALGLSCKNTLGKRSRTRAENVQLPISQQKTREKLWLESETVWGCM